MRRLVTSRLTHLDLHCLYRYLFWSTGVKGLQFVLLINLKLLTNANSFLLNTAEHENFSAFKYENANYLAFSYLFAENISCLAELSTKTSFIISGARLTFRTSMARTSLGPLKFVWNMGGSSHWGLTMTPGQEANGDQLFSIFYIIIVCCMYSLESPRWGDSNEYIQHTISW